MSKTILFLPSFILSYFSDGQNSEMVMILKKNGNIIVWNNKEIRINNKPIFNRTLFENGITFVNNLLFDT